MSPAHDTGTAEELAGPPAPGGPPALGGRVEAADVPGIPGARHVRHVAPQEHVFAPIRVSVRRVGDELRGSVPVMPELYVPGTTCVRMAALVVWSDFLGGRMSVGVLAPRVPVTLDLNVELYTRFWETSEVRVTGRLVKTGRSVVVSAADFRHPDGTPLALATAAFMTAGDPSLVMPPLRWADEDEDDAAWVPRPPLRAALAEHAGCEVRAPGVAAVARTANGLNASDTINGGLIALAAEEAALSLTPGVPLASMLLRYLSPARRGPAVATARVSGGLGVVEVRDAGAEDRLAVHAVTRSFPDTVGM
ncbi:MULTISPECIES: PaaI family thioesterase [unclassified Pseudofrankia]|uniref:PaaI family thioesterase n=1 Tax=unclassified Pseudofrankia TaxID=2994372 RepID=UPI0009F4ED04|nr:MULTISPECIES: thioesterase [unclassified Pseudofrankia]MDT3441445.1 PaaI family thioesterase [Pseudofrankia sp. BMG5.37]